jgi:glycosyltransferase involved in cell wall biosynthesis
MIRLHILAIPHTITADEYSHCAFTGKVLRFSPMMISRGFEVYHYGVETSEPNATKNIDLLTKKEWDELRVLSYKKLYPALAQEEINHKINDKKTFIGELAFLNTPLYEEFNKRLRISLHEHYRGTTTDIICLPFGKAHDAAIKDFNGISVETGIGYPDSYLKYRIFESYAQLHSVLAKENTQNQNYWFVVPNYYNVLEWPLSLTPKCQIGFFGRICHIKGCDVFVEVAKKFPHIDFILCGQGNPDPYLKRSPNILYRPPLHSDERGKFLSNITALLVPSYYVEPFCGVNVEAQLCGTPVITVDNGAFTETIEPFKTGVLCHTLSDYCNGIQMALDGKFDREYIGTRARKLYDMYNVAKKYEYSFKNILEIHNGNNGWYSNECFLDLLK